MITYAHNYVVMHEQFDYDSVKMVRMSRMHTVCVHARTCVSTSTSL